MKKAWRVYKTQNIDMLDPRGPQYKQSYYLIRLR